MSEKTESGKKRSKAYYRKCAHGGKRQRLSANVLEPGIRGFLVMCNHNEKNAVRESYNLLNEYADHISSSKPFTNTQKCMQTQDENKSSESSDEDDVEKAMEKEIEGMKAVDSSHKRFQNVSTKAKNCVFIRTTLENPVEIVTVLMNDIASKKLNKARFAARILPIIGTCKANISDIEKLAADALKTIFSSNEDIMPKSYTILFKSRNNNGSSCGREGVVSSLIKVVKDINPCVKFTWTDFSIAILVEIVCTICCLGVAPDYIRLRKYNLQELTKGDKTEDAAVPEEEEERKVRGDSKNDDESSGNATEDLATEVTSAEKKETSGSCEAKIHSSVCNDEDENITDIVAETSETQELISPTKKNRENINGTESDKTDCLSERDIMVKDKEERETEV